MPEKKTHGFITSLRQERNCPVTVIQVGFYDPDRACVS